MLLRKAVGTHLHIPLMGNPLDFPVYIFSLMALLFVYLLKIHCTGGKEASGLYGTKPVSICLKSPKLARFFCFWNPFYLSLLSITVTTSRIFLSKISVSWGLFLQSFFHWEEGNIPARLPEICIRAIVCCEPNLKYHRLTRRQRKTLANITLWNST